MNGEITLTVKKNDLLALRKDLDWSYREFRILKEEIREYLAEECNEEIILHNLSFSEMMSFWWSTSKDFPFTRLSFFKRKVPGLEELFELLEEVRFKYRDLEKILESLDMFEQDESKIFHEITMSLSAYKQYFRDYKELALKAWDQFDESTDKILRWKNS